MRALLRRLRITPNRPEHPTTGACPPATGGSRPTGREYRSASYLPLRPWQVRGRRFATTRRGRRGLDPGEVGAFLDRVATDLHTVYLELARSQEETTRVKQALRDWQSRQAPSMRELARQ